MTMDFYLIPQLRYIFVVFVIEKLMAEKMFYKIDK